MSGTEKVPGISEEAVERAARFLYERHVILMEYHPRPRWEDEAEEHRDTWRAQARPILDRALPAIRQQVLAEVKEGLLGEEAVEATAFALDSYGGESWGEMARIAVEAALATLTPEEEK